MDRMNESLFDEEARIAFRNKLENSLSILNAQIERLRLRYSEMEAKSKEYFEKVVECLVNTDEDRAKIYAEEIVEIKRLAEMVKKSQLLLLQVKIRLETIIETTEVIGLIFPLTSLLTEVEDELRPVAPEIVQSLHELSACIEEFTTTTVYNKLELVKHEELSSEAEKILLEAQRNAVEIVKNKFPDIPNLNEKEIKIYSYISKIGDEIDLRKCSEELKIDVREIKKVLASLEEKGLVEVEGT